jgi:hypothetical protein
MSFFARIRRSEPDLAFCAAVACALAALVFVLQGHVGLGMQDESFLWYGVQRTHAGELPLRDFRSYDPGRYFWCAAWAALLGDGIVAVRASSWIFAAIGLTCGLLAARRAVTNRWWLILVGVLLVVWMHPPWKLFESSLAMIAVLFATRLVEQPSRARHVVAGACVGLTAFFARNYGLYTGVAFGVLVLYVAWKERARDFLVRIAALALGVVIGYAPMLVLCALSPGFATAFVESVAFYLGQNALNAELPVPWPWRVSYAGRGVWSAIAVFCVGLFFVLRVVFYLGALIPIARTKPDDLPKRALLIASVFVGGLVGHHAAVRSDLAHLAQSIHPLLMGMISLPAALGWTRVKFAGCVVLASLLVASGFAVVPSMPFVQRITADEPYVETLIGSEHVYLSPNDARSVESLRAIVTAHVRADQTLWVGAHFIGLYPILGRKSPVWDIYPAWRANDALQQRMLEELARVDWVLLLDRPIGGDPNMILPVSHPRVFERLTLEFERVKLPGAPDSLFLLGRKGAR